jgi:hypothetical protein
VKKTKTTRLLPQSSSSSKAFCRNGGNCQANAKGGEDTPRENTTRGGCFPSLGVGIVCVDYHFCFFCIELLVMSEIMLIFATETKTDNALC